MDGMFLFVNTYVLFKISYFSLVFLRNLIIFAEFIIFFSFQLLIGFLTQVNYIFVYILKFHCKYEKENCTVWLNM